MKKIILVLAVIVFMAGSISKTNGQEPDKKSVKARENLQEEKKDVVEAKLDLKEAQKDSVSDYQKFKKESEIKIKDNEKRIADLKVKHSKMNKKDNAAYQKKIIGLEQKNTALKKKLDNQNNLNNKNNKEGSEKWASFKREFNHDMDELGKALRDFTLNNKK